MEPSLCCSSCHEDLIRGPAPLSPPIGVPACPQPVSFITFEFLATLPGQLTSLSMDSKLRQKVFTLNAIVDGHIIRGKVKFSPAPPPGIMTEVARFEAERLLAQMVREEIAAGRL